MKNKCVVQKKESNMMMNIMKKKMMTMMNMMRMPNTLMKMDILFLQKLSSISRKSVGFKNNFNSSNSNNKWQVQAKHKRKILLQTQRDIHNNLLSINNNNLNSNLPLSQMINLLEKLQPLNNNSNSNNSLLKKLLNLKSQVRKNSKTKKMKKMNI